MFRSIVKLRDRASGIEENPMFKSSRVFMALLALAGLGQGCHRMESRRAMSGPSRGDAGMSVPSSPAPMYAPGEGSGSGAMRGYRASEGS